MNEWIETITNDNDNETNLDDGTIPDAIVAASEHGNEIDDETIKTVSADRSSITNTLEHNTNNTNQLQPFLIAVRYGNTVHELVI